MPRSRSAIDVVVAQPIEAGGRSRQIWDRRARARGLGRKPLWRPIMDESDSQLIARIERTLTNHLPVGMDVGRVDALLGSFKSAARAIIAGCPPDRHRSLALTHLEDACMRAIKSIVLEGVDCY